MNKLPLLAVPAAIALASCGLIPTPAVPVPDTTLPLSASANLAAGSVVYISTDVLKGVSLPSLLQQLSISGNAQYNAAGGTLSSANIYVRSSLINLPATCMALPATTTTPALTLCAESGETAQKIGTVNLSAGTKVPFTLTGAALDNAAKSGHGYFGVQMGSGVSLSGESISLTDLKAQAKL